MDKRFDVIIVGSGAGGGPIARHLAPSGKNLLILERGDWLKREAGNRNGGVRAQLLRLSGPMGRPPGRPFQPQVHYFVGGATKLSGTARYRLRQEDFGELPGCARDLTRAKSPPCSRKPFRWLCPPGPDLPVRH